MIKSALAYIVFAWVVTQVVAIVFPTFGASTALVRTIILVLVFAFPFWLIFSWVYEITPEGIKKTASVKPEESIAPQTNNKLNKIIIAGLAVAIILLVYTIIQQKQVLPKPQAKEGMVTDRIDKSIAVLAFDDMSPGKDQEYFSDGISEAILNLLTKMPDLKVISRTSSFYYKGKEQNIKEIGKELQVGYVLEGSVRKSGDTFRITTQLIDAQSGAHVWSETYDRNMEDIFKIQDEIALMVARQLKATLFKNTIAPKTVDTEAYNLYLQAKQVKKNNLEGLENGKKLVQESIAIDSLYAPAWSLYAGFIYELSFSYVAMSREDGISQGMHAAKKAIDLDPEFAEGYLYLARFEAASWNFKKEAELINKAMELDPNNIAVIRTNALSALNKGNIKLAIGLQLKAIEIDPISSIPKVYLGLMYWINERYGDAEAAVNDYIMLNPDSDLGHDMMAQIQLALGQPEKALESNKKNDDSFWHLYRKCMIVYDLNNIKEADRLLQELIEKWGHNAWPNIAHVYAHRKNKDEAFKWLDMAFKNKDASLLEILNYPEMKNLWGDPRWNQFINKLGLPKDHGFHLD